MTNKEFKQKLIELNVLVLYLGSVKECESGVDLTTGKETDYSFSDRVSCSFIWSSAKSQKERVRMIFGGAYPNQNSPF